MSFGQDGSVDSQTRFDSRAVLDACLEDRGISFDGLKKLTEFKDKQNFLLDLYWRSVDQVDGRLSVSDYRKQMLSSRINFLEYPNERTKLWITCPNMQGYLIYPKNIYAYRALPNQDDDRKGSIIVITNDLHREKPKIENMFSKKSEKVHEGGEDRLLLNFHPFNPLCIFEYGSDMPKIPKELENLLFQDFLKEL